MRILIDVQTLYTGEKKRGIGKYTTWWLINLINLNDQDRYYLIRKKNGRWQFTFISKYLDLDKQLLNDSVWETNSIENFIRKNEIDIVHFTSPLMLDIEIPVIINSTVKKSYLIYDLIPLIFKQHYYDKWPVHLQHEYTKRLNILREADLILTISESTKADLGTYLNMDKEKVFVINASVNASLLNITENRKIQQDLNITKPFIFSLTGFDWRKNNDTLISVFSKISKRYQNYKFVIAGIGHESEINRLKAVGASKGLKDNELYILNYLPDASLVSLYKDCEAFVFPSLYEGFGMPVLEAMCFGAPVVVSNNSSLPELTNNCGIVVDPFDEDSILTGIVHVIADKCIAENLKEKSLQRSKEFSWVKTAQMSLQGFHHVKSYSLVKFQSQKPVLAFFSPLQPQSSGISDYSEKLLMGLKEFFDIKIFISKFYPSNPEIIDHFQIFDYHQHKKLLENINYKIYHIGNSVFHDWIYEALKEYPGIIVLHDLNLYEFHRYTKLLNHKEMEFIQEILYCHTMEALKWINQMKTSNNVEFLRFPMFKKVVELSNGIIAHSSFVKESILSNTTYKGEIKVIPMGTSVSVLNSQKTLLIKKKLGIDTQNISIGVFGRVHPYKRIDVIIRSFAKLITKFSHLQLFIIGFCDESYQRELLKLAMSLGVKKKIHFISSPVTDNLNIFNQYIEAVDICINLRWPTMGETSATLISALGYGKPCIVTNAGAFKEYPDDFVWKVDADQGFEEELLTTYLYVLCNSPSLRQKMSELASSYMDKYHNRREWSKQYKDFILDQQRK